MADLTDPGRDPSPLERLWEGRGGPLVHGLGALLAVPELAFRAVVATRGAAYSAGMLPSRPASAPTICVGNITVGGTGKTPMVRWLVGELLARGRRPGILHGGYADDEPALHRRWFPDLPVVVDRDRVRGARAAVASGADTLVLDDGFQHRRLQRDLDVVLVSAEGWAAPARLLPRGPYREPRRALGRADVVVVTRRTAGPDTAEAVSREIARRWNPSTAVVALEAGGWLTAAGRPREGAPGSGAVAVAAIGRPRAFFRQVEGRGVRLERTLAFRDHHAYTPEDGAAIQAAARGAAVITTAKDAVKLIDVLDADLWVLDQKVRFEGGRDHLLNRLEEATA